MSSSTLRPLWHLGYRHRSCKSKSAFSRPFHHPARYVAALMSATERTDVPRQHCSASTDLGMQDLVARVRQSAAYVSCLAAHVAVDENGTLLQNPMSTEASVQDR
jgi:hypothetical protein